MSETRAVFQLAMFWLKADAEENICELSHWRRSTPYSVFGAMHAKHERWQDSSDAEHCRRMSQRMPDGRAPSRLDEHYPDIACHAKDHTLNIVETPAVFHPPMFSLKADAM